MTLLSARNLSLNLGRKTVVRNLDFTLRPRELVGLLGQNGAGKTTLIRGLMGLLPAAGGDVLLDGRLFAEVPPEQRATMLSYLPQGRQVHWPLDVFHLVALGRLPHQTPFDGLSTNDVKQVNQALAYTDVSHLSDRPVTELSGGELARVLLARALASEPRVLLADEPVAGLDPAHQIDVMRLLADLAHKGASVLVVLHDLTLAARYCDRVLVINDGALAGDGPPDEVLTPEVLEDCFGIKVFMRRDGGELFLVPTARSEAV